MRVVILFSFLGLISCSQKESEKASPLLEKQITEFKDEARRALPEGVTKELVVANCVHCHSYKLVTQNSATREGWQSMIIWMQETQGLWPLGNAEDQILDYLSEHFAPKNTGRRAPLSNVEWYELK